MNKLSKSNSKKDFLKCAKDIICYQQGTFTFDEIMIKMFNCCEGNVEEDFIRDVVIIALTHLIRIGIVHHRVGLLYEANEIYCQI